MDEKKNNVVQLRPPKSRRIQPSHRDLEAEDRERRIKATKGLAREAWFVPVAPTVLALAVSWKLALVIGSLATLFYLFMLSTTRYGRES